MVPGGQRHPKHAGASLVVCVNSVQNSLCFGWASLLPPPHSVSPWAAKTRLRWTRQIWRMWRKWKRRRREKMKTAKVGLYVKMLQYRGSVSYNAFNTWINVCEMERIHFRWWIVPTFWSFRCVEKCQSSRVTEWTLYPSAWYLNGAEIFAWFWFVVEGWEALIHFILGICLCILWCSINGLDTSFIYQPTPSSLWIDIDGCLALSINSKFE